MRLLIACSAKSFPLSDLHRYKMTLLFNWPRRTPYLNQLDRAQRNSRLSLPCDGRCRPTGGPTYAPTIMRSLTAPAAIVAPSALGLCSDKPVAGGLCPVCRSGIVNGTRTSGLLCCRSHHSPACPACGVVFEDAEDEISQHPYSKGGSNKRFQIRRVKDQRTKPSKGGNNSSSSSSNNNKNKHQEDMLLKPHSKEQEGEKKKSTLNKTAEK